LNSTSSQLKQYLVALKNIVKDAKNIIAASKISQDRILVFLKSKELVDTFMKQGATIEIENNHIKGRRLLNPAKKVVFSNVSATIPNSVLHTYISNQLNFKLASPITVLRAEPNDEEFAHIISCRRQVYITNFEEVYENSSFTLTYNSHEHHIFINFDEPTCFLCHSTSHKAANCQINGSSLSSSNDVRDKVESTPFQERIELAHIKAQSNLGKGNSNIKLDSQALTQEENIKSTNNAENAKHPPPSSISSQTSSNSDAKPATKKQKESIPSSAELKKALNSLKVTMEAQPKNFPINFSNFIILLESASTSPIDQFPAAVTSMVPVKKDQRNLLSMCSTALTNTEDLPMKTSINKTINKSKTLWK